MTSLCRVALLCLLGLGSALALPAPARAAVPAHSRPSASLLRVPAAAPRHPRLLKAAGLRRNAPLGAAHRPGKTITARTVPRSLSR